LIQLFLVYFNQNLIAKRHSVVLCLDKYLFTSITFYHAITMQSVEIKRSAKHCNLLFQPCLDVNIYWCIVSTLQFMIKVDQVFHKSIYNVL
jgi:hypothetical protein